MKMAQGVTSLPEPGEAHGTTMVEDWNWKAREMAVPRLAAARCDVAQWQFVGTGKGGGEGRVCVRICSPLGRGLIEHSGPNVLPV